MNQATNLGPYRNGGNTYRISVSYMSTGHRLIFTYEVWVTKKYLQEKENIEDITSEVLQDVGLKLFEARMDQANMNPQEREMYVGSKGKQFGPRGSFPSSIKDFDEED